MWRLRASESKRGREERRVRKSFRGRWRKERKKEGRGRERERWIDRSCCVLFSPSNSTLIPGTLLPLLLFPATSAPLGGRRSLAQNFASASSREYISCFSPKPKTQDEDDRRARNPARNSRPFLQIGVCREPEREGKGQARRRQTDGGGAVSKINGIFEAIWGLVGTTRDGSG